MPAPRAVEDVCRYSSGSPRSVARSTVNPSFTDFVEGRNERLENQDSRRSPAYQRHHRVWGKKRRRTEKIRRRHPRFLRQKHADRISFDRVAPTIGEKRSAVDDLAVRWIGKLTGESRSNHSRNAKRKRGTKKKLKMRVIESLLELAEPHFLPSLKFFTTLPPYSFSTHHS